MATKYRMYGGGTMIVKKMRLITEIEDGKTLDEEFQVSDKFMADIAVAIRHGKSPVKALAFLADIGSDHEGPIYLGKESEYYQIMWQHLIGRDEMKG